MPNANPGKPIINRRMEDVSDKLLCLIMLAIYLDKFKKFEPLHGYLNKRLFSYRLQVLRMQMIQINQKGSRNQIPVPAAVENFKYVTCAP